MHVKYDWNRNDKLYNSSEEDDEYFDKAKFHGPFYDKWVAKFLGEETALNDATKNNDTLDEHVAINAEIMSIATSDDEYDMPINYDDNNHSEDKYDTTYDIRNLFGIACSLVRVVR